MDLVDVEVILGRERIVFYYLAEKRVDFRELVKDLARAFQTRIEMRQIGVRDEAKLLADYGDCGKPVCCNTHLTRDAAGLDEDGQAPEDHARPLQDLGPLRPAQVLPAVRVRHLPRARARTAAGRLAGRDHARGRAGSWPRRSWPRSWSSSSRTAGGSSSATTRSSASSPPAAGRRGRPDVRARSAPALRRPGARDRPGERDRERRVARARCGRPAD